jgi:hypothetical protein
MYVPEGTKNVGTARVREDRTVGASYAQRELMRRIGNQPASQFDDIAAGYDPFADAPLMPQPAKKLPKYRNTKCEHNGIKFDSQKEMTRWFHLIHLQAAGRIRDLRLQVPYVLTARKQRDDGSWERASRYVADFVYFDVDAGKEVVEDVKSVATRKNRAYVEKRKQMLAVHNISIKEI